MVKLCGSLCIFAGCGYAWYLQWMQRRNQRNVRIELLAALRIMEQEIRNRQTTIPHLAERLAGETEGDVKHCFETFYTLLGRDILPAQAWETAIAGLPLSAEEKRGISALGRGISQEESYVVKELNLTIKELEMQKEQAEKQQSETEKRASALWLSAAALLVILLI